jgi:hypothetical protein
LKRLAGVGLDWGVKELSAINHRVREDDRPKADS